MKHFCLKSRHPLPLSLILAALLAGFITGCDTPDETPDYEPRYFGPIVDSRINIEDISQLEDIILKQEVDPTDIRSSFNGTLDVPALNLDQPVGPYPLEITDVFEKVVADTFIFETRIENTMPIPISAGTDLVFRNESNDTLLYRRTLQQDVAPGEQITIRETLTDREVESNVDFYLENFTTEGSNGQVTFDAIDAGNFEFELIFLDIEELIINKGQSYTINDTSNVSYTRSANPDSSVAGELYVSINNLFPVRFDLQLNFLDEDNGQVIDSVLTSRISLPGSPVNAQGRVIGEKTRTTDTIQIDRGQLQALKNADQVASEFRAESLTRDFQGNPINSVVLEIEENSFMRLLIGTDAKLFVE